MSNTIKLYSSHPVAIVDSIQLGHTHYAKMSYIKEKYGEAVAPIFMNAYNWFIQHAEHIVMRPQEAESAIWCYYDLFNLEKHQDYEILELAVPLDQVIFFSMDDWSKILNLRYMGKSTQEEVIFAQKIEQHGINYEGDIFRKPFYPQLKQEITKSWLNLFRFHQQIQQAFAQKKPPPIKNIQAAIWQLPKTWVTKII